MLSIHETVTISLGEVSEMARSVLVKAGLPDHHAQIIARVITASERDGYGTHGLHRLPGCLETMAHPRFRRDASPVAEDISPAATRVDASFGFSLPAFEAGLPLLVQKTKTLGIGLLAINRGFHFTAIWPEIEALTARGLAAMAMMPGNSWVAPSGGTKPLLGTNPLAFGWPRAGGTPYIFDMATSAASRSEIARHRAAGQSVPDGWGLDADGAPTNDAGKILAGSMLTFGGHKGTAIATMIELLAGPLIGDMISMEATIFDAGARAAPCHGELIIAFDPAVLAGNDNARAEESAEALFAAFGDSGARLPSDRRYATREESLRNGVKVPAQLYERIRALM